MDGVTRWCSGARDNGNRKMGLFKERHDKTSDMNGHCAVARETTQSDWRVSDQVALLSDFRGWNKLEQWEL